MEDVSASKVGLIILDACRDNPFVQKMKRSSTRSVIRDVGRLGSVEPTGISSSRTPQNMNESVRQETGRNSPFTAALIANLQTPGMEDDTLFRYVRDEVKQKTSDKQQPFTYGSLPKESIFINPPEDGREVAPQDDAAWEILEETIAGMRTEEIFKDSFLLVDAAEANGLDIFLKRYPESSHAAEAKPRMLELRKKLADVPPQAFGTGEDGILWRTAEGASPASGSRRSSTNASCGSLAAELLIMEEFAKQFPKSGHTSLPTIASKS